MTARQPTAAMYAALAAPRPTDVTQTPPPKGAAVPAGRPHCRPLGELMRAFASTPPASR